MHFVLLALACMSLPSQAKFVTITDEVDTEINSLVQIMQEAKHEVICNLPDTYTVKWCDSKNNGNAMQHGSVCTLIHNGREITTVCNNGKWLNREDGEITLKRAKRSHRKRCITTRFWWQIRRRCTVLNHKPYFRRCTPRITTFFTPPATTSMIVKWQLPGAYDDEDGLLRAVAIRRKVLKGCSGWWVWRRCTYKTLPHNGDTFGGSSAGVKHGITYRATDKAGACASCYFQITVKAVLCTAPVRPKFGEVSCPSGTYYGQRCTFLCQTGYKPSVASTTCRSDKTWSHGSGAVYCTAAQCSSILPTFTHGSYQCNGYTYNNLCYPSCQSGYTISRSDPIRCGSTGAWIPAVSGTPQCKDSDPPLLHNCPASIAVTSDSMDASAIVTWVPPTATDAQDTTNPILKKVGSISPGDHVQAGNYTIVYTAFDSAGNPSKLCSFKVTVYVITCPELTPLSKGQYICSPGYMYGSTCTCICESGYNILGSTEVTCQKTGLWDYLNGFPSCQVITCPTPDNFGLTVLNGKYICPTPIVFQSVCFANCTDGYALVQQSSAVCTTDNNNQASYIETVRPICKDILPPVFIDCKRSKTFTFPADKGSTSATITWTLPTAKDNTDAVPTVKQISGSLVNGSTLNADSTATVVFQATDLENNPSDVCVYIFNVNVTECEVFIPPIWGTVYCDNGNVYGSVCKIDCHDGYELFGSDATECFIDGTWSDFPECLAIYCLDAPNVFDNGEYDCPNNTYNTICEPKCDDGFALAEFTYAICSSNKQWVVETDPACKDIKSPVWKNCPTNRITFKADFKQRSTIVSWTPPTASDNVDRNPTVNKTSGPNINDRIEGEAFVKYQASDIAGNPSDVCIIHLIVEVIQCTSLPWPDNGKYGCDQGIIYGSTCTYTCDEGYELENLNNSQIQCDSNGAWTFVDKLPGCKIKTCDPPEERANGEFVCFGQSYEYKSGCTLDCKRGFSTNIINTAKCTASGTWYYNADEECQDITPPILDNCETYQTFYVERLSDKTAPNWTLPTATDNHDTTDDIVIEQIAGPNIGLLLDVGETTVEYRAVDAAGNPSFKTCSITVNVKDVYCNSTDALFSDDKLLFQCSSYKYGQTCSILCKDKVPLRAGSPNNITCEANFTNSHPTSFWYYDGTEEPSCEESTCPQTLEEPKNGSLSYSGNVAYVLCDEGHDLPMGSNAFRLCSGSAWVPNTSLHCTRERYVSESVMDAEFHYSGNCSSPKVLLDIKLKVIAQLEQFFKQLGTTVNAPSCIKESSCGFDDIDVVCGETKKRRKRAASDSGTIIVAFKLTITRSVTSYESVVSIEDKMNELWPYVSEAVDNGHFNSENYTVISYNSTGSITFSCEPGTVLDVWKCKSCSVGQYLNTLGSTTGSCMDCPIGTFMDHDAATECLPCLAGYSTNATGKTSADSCTEMCPPGYVSLAGVMPCTPCRIGYIQPGSGMTSCNKCPYEKTTFTLGGTTCSKYDLVIGSGLYYTIPTEMIVNTLSVSFWYRMTSGSVLQFTATGIYGEEAEPGFVTSDIFEVQIGEESRVQFGSEVVSLRSVQMDKWTHFTLIYASVIRVFIDGVVEYSTPSALPLSAARLYFEMTTNSATSIRFSGMGIFGYELNTTDITSLTASCQLEVVDAVIDTDYLLDQRISSINAQPQTCLVKDPCIPNPCCTHACTAIDSEFKCTCNNGHTGDTCETEPNNCNEHDCLNGASCISNARNYTCECPNGFSGSFCEKSPVNGIWSIWSEWTICSASCDGGIQTRTRTCDSPAPEPYGLDCEGSATEDQQCNTVTCETLDPCLSSPCGIHKCRLTLDGYECKCNTGYTGSMCDNATDNCESSNCLNGGVCISKDIGYVCQCSDQFIGTFCESAAVTGHYWSTWSPCSSACNGGTATRTKRCVSQTNLSTCSEETDTKTCNTEACIEDKCLSSPCGNHTCVSSVTGYKCVCSSGYTGDTCREQIDFCSQHKCDHGQCTSIGGGYTCQCEDDYTGELCTIPPVDGGWRDWNQWSSCSSSCGQGTRERTRQCDNPVKGEGGKECEGQPLDVETCVTTCLDYCDSNPCGIDHDCLVEDNGYTCHCNNGYTGDTCTVPPDYCDPNPCNNGGVCTSTKDGFSCACVNELSGETCDENPDLSAWSIWSEWDACSKSCKGGVQQRHRSCEFGSNNKPCTEASYEVIKCSEDNCPECSELPEKYGMRKECNISGDLQTCTMTCLDGYRLSNGTELVEIYRCGTETSFEWDQTKEIPSCSAATLPKKVTVPSTLVVSPVVSCDKRSSVEESYTSVMTSTKCNTISNCTISVSVSGCDNNNRRKRESDSGSTLTITVTLDIGDTNATGEAISEETDHYYDILDNTVGYIYNSSSEQMSVTIDGITYTANTSTTETDVDIECPTGYNTDDFACVGCSPGTMFDENLGFCVSCPQNSTQELTGQTDCIKCPDGYLTILAGSWNSSDCLEIPENMTSTSTEYNDDSLDIGVVVGSTVAVVAALLIVVIILVIRFKIVKHGKVEHSNESYSNETYEQPYKQDVNGRQSFGRPKTACSIVSQSHLEVDFFK